MATTVKELLNIGSTKAVPHPWSLNVSSDNASTAREILAAEAGKRHWVEQVNVTAVTPATDTDWWVLLDGATPVIGYILTERGVQWTCEFHKAIPCTMNTALNIQTATNFRIHYLIEGYTDAYPEVAYSPAPADEATGVDVDTDLQWVSAPWIALHNVYFGTSVASLALQGDTADQSYDIGTMESLTTYYWRIDGDGLTGNVWSFTTE